MTEHADLMRQSLEALDVVTLRKLWAHVSPHLPQPTSDEQALIMAHVARTASDSVREPQRLYSYAWLRDHGYPNRLPDHLKPKAERTYPRAVGAVGISVNSKYPVVRDAIRGVMEDAVLETYADGHADAPEIVKARMMEARERERKGLGLPRLPRV